MYHLVYPGLSTILFFGTFLTVCHFRTGFLRRNGGREFFCVGDISIPGMHHCDEKVKRFLPARQNKRFL